MINALTHGMCMVKSIYLKFSCTRNIFSSWPIPVTYIRSFLFDPAQTLSTASFSEFSLAQNLIFVPKLPGLSQKTSFQFNGYKGIPDNNVCGYTSAYRRDFHPQYVFENLVIVFALLK